MLFLFLNAILLSFNLIFFILFSIFNFNEKNIFKRKYLLVNIVFLFIKFRICGFYIILEFFKYFLYICINLYRVV